MCVVPRTGPQARPGDSCGSEVPQGVGAPRATERCPSGLGHAEVVQVNAAGMRLRKQSLGTGRRAGVLTREERIKVRRRETGQDSMVTQRQKMTGRKKA